MVASPLSASRSLDLGTENAGEASPSWNFSATKS